MKHLLAVFFRSSAKHPGHFPHVNWNDVFKPADTKPIKCVPDLLDPDNSKAKQDEEETEHLFKSSGIAW